MFTTRLFAFAAVAAALVNGATLVDKAKPASDPGALDLSGTNTDATSIAQTVSNVDQKTGVPDNAPPNLPPANTSVTATDGSIFDDPTPVNSTRRALERRIPGRFPGRTPAKRSVSDYEIVFNGTGTDLTARDGSIQGTAYLTYTVVANSTYNVKACLDFCSGVDGCVFANLYYEFNNPGIDAGPSNLKCAVYGDIHTAAEKTNKGGQNLGYGDDHLTFIQQSSGFAAKFIEDPATPEGYELVYGPTDGANNAPGYMGFAFLTQYDVSACASLCNTRGADAQGGACQFFNIWRALVNGNPTTYTCSMYFVPSDASTAVNYGQGDLKVTFSRGYRRISSVLDGGFESYNDCPDDICWTESDANWIGTSPKGGHWDALIFSYPPYAHAGHSVASFGSGDGVDSLSGTLTPAKPLSLKPGRIYSLQFFYSSNFNGDLETNASLTVKLNGKVIATINAGNIPWTFYQYNFVSKGNDVLVFQGGSYPSYVMMDDVNVYLTYQDTL